MTYLSLPIILLVIWTHLIADFFLQSDKMAKGKSSSNKLLSIHVGIYVLPFWLLFGLKYALVNYVLHWLTDYVSSRATSKLWAEKKVHWFFCVVGVDQAVHLTCLLLTLGMLT